MKNNDNRSNNNESGFVSFKKHWKSDLISGFLVFLLALPLSLGIAKASGFPAAMGVLAAIIGGLLTTFFKVSELSIKGPAAGLITICAAAVLDFGGEAVGWHAVAAIIVVAAVFQVIFGLIKLGSLSDFFPPAAVHGMLAAIGIIIIAKQIPVLLGDEPSLYQGESPLELFMDIPSFISHAHWHIAIIGALGLAVMFWLPKLGFPIVRKIPAPLVVLILTIPLALFWDFNSTEPEYSMVHIGDFWGSLALNADFTWITTFKFWKYVIMILFVNSLESLLTVKAVDQLDHSPRIANPNGDLVAVGVGNFVSGLLGGTPIISEVVRSSANIGFGAQSKWSNFFQGLFLLLAMILLIPFIEMIPNAALAAMLLYAGVRLASPKEFIHIYQIGKEQLVVFMVTIVVTLAEDLLLGIAAGIFVKFLSHLYYGASISDFFKSRFTLTQNLDNIHIEVSGAALFSNLIGFKKCLQSLPEKSSVVFDLSQSHLVDHSFMEFIRYFQSEYNSRGGTFQVTGLDLHVSLSRHPMATRKLVILK